MPHNTADIAVAADAAGVVAVCNAGAGADATAAIPHNTADKVVAADLADVAAVFDAAAAVIPHNAADTHSAADAAGDGEVFHDAASADIAKEALIIGASVDIEAADGVPVAVEGAAVSAAVAADWGPLVKLVAIGDFAVFVNLHVWVEVDIVGEDGVGVGADLAIVDALRKFQQIRCGSNLVRIILRAVAVQRSPLTTL